MFAAHAMALALRVLRRFLLLPSCTNGWGKRGGERGLCSLYAPHILYFLVQKLVYNRLIMFLLAPYPLV